MMANYSVLSYRRSRLGVNVTYTGISECVADVSRWFLLISQPYKDWSSPVRHQSSARKDINSGWPERQRGSSTTPWNCLVSHWTLVWRWTGTSLEFYYHMHVLRDIRPLLTLNAAKMITHSVVSSRLDYANTVLHGTSATNLN